MVKSAIKVVVRVRPTPDFAQGAIDLHQDKKVRAAKQRSRRSLQNVSRSGAPDGGGARLLQSVKLHLPKNAKFGDVVNSQPQDYNFKCAAAPPVVCECAAAQAA